MAHSPYSLPASIRKLLYPDIDVPKLERLLDALPDEARLYVLRCCIDYPDRRELLKAFPELGPDSDRAIVIPSIDDLIFEDPRLQRLLDELIRSRHNRA